MRALVVGSLLLVIALGGGVLKASAEAVDGVRGDAASASLQARLQALHALGQSGDVRALPPLLAALRDDNPTVRECAAAALRSLARALRGLYDTVAQWIEGLLATLDGPAAPSVEWTQHPQRI